MAIRMHLRAMRAAEKAVYRAVELYAQQGHEDLFQASVELLKKARIATETVAFAAQAHDFAATQRVED